MDFELVPLYSRLDLIEPCIEIQRIEWPDGKYDRLEKMESSCPNPPCSLAFISKQGHETVVGHCRIIPIKDSENALYIEAVVIDKANRGKGIGKTLMLRLEDYCNDRGYEELYVDTSIDTVRFYTQLGYCYTDNRPEVVGSGILDATIQVLCSIPYPGWEHYYKPYDGRKIKTTEQTDRDSSSELSSQKSSACADKGDDETPSSVERSKDVDAAPSWAFDVNGFCWLKKCIKRCGSS